MRKGMVNLLEERRKSAEFRISNQFDIPSIHNQGRYYFVNNAKESLHNGKPCIEIQAIYKTHKWVQDTIYLTDFEFYDRMVKFAKEKGII